VILLQRKNGRDVKLTNYFYVVSRLGIDRASWYSDSLQPGRSGDRIPVGARFSAHVQTGLGAHPACFTRGTGSFPGVKRQGRGVDHPPPSGAEVKGRVELYIYTENVQRDTTLVS
jgi:hypothetical protein